MVVNLAIPITAETKQVSVNLHNAHKNIFVLPVNTESYLLVLRIKYDFFSGCLKNIPHSFIYFAIFIPLKQEKEEMYE
jgi:hypothetical protein